MSEERVRTDVARTSAGDVKGYKKGPINVFKGIPYGQVGPHNRFRLAEPAMAWTGVRDALEVGPRCPQETRGGGGVLLGGGRVEESAEDCLVLNVWTPGLRDGVKRPVMVWFHGGGYTSLSGGSGGYDGVNLCTKGDVVVVTLNHRLNVFGHLYLADILGDEFADSGNVGVLDLIQALHWVRDNIAEFGGDPGNVTIFGESGGGGKVMTLSTMEKAIGLFHRAIVQSGSLIICLDRDVATDNSYAYMEALGLGRGDGRKLLDLPIEPMVKALRAMGAGPSAKHNLGPVIDGRSVFGTQIDVDGLKVTADIPLLVGTNTHEMTLLFGPADTSLFKLSWEELPARLAEHLPGLSPEKIVAALRQSRPQASASDIFFLLTSERFFGHGSRVQASRKTALGVAPAYHYELTWPTPIEGGKFGTPHALDVPLVFNNVDKSRGLLGEGDDPQIVADQMSSAWIAFAHTGNPRWQGGPDWPAYTEAKRETMVFNLQSRIEANRHADLLAALSPIPPLRVAK